jgi:RNA polymerase sigma-70 factor (ECF subfamily)
MSGKVSYLSFADRDLSEMSDEALVAAAAGQDPALNRAALGELFSRYHKDVYRFITRLLFSDAPDLDDMVQNTFIEVGRSASRFAGRSSPKTWIFGIAANVVRTRRRSEKRRFRALSILEKLPFFHSASPIEQVENKQVLEKMQSAMNQLPTPIRLVFVLCVLENVPCAEAARTLGIPEGTLWRRLHDARVRLAQDVGKEA